MNDSKRKSPNISPCTVHMFLASQIKIYKSNITCLFTIILNQQPSMVYELTLPAALESLLWKDYNVIRFVMFNTLRVSTSLTDL